MAAIVAKSLRVFMASSGCYDDDVDEDAGNEGYLTFEMEVIGLFSLSNHSTFGGGLPCAIQSAMFPAVLVNSMRLGGSCEKFGPWVSK